MDMGTKNRPVGVSSKNHISYPCFSLRDDKIPDELAKTEVGSMCRLEILVKKVADSVSSYDNGEQRVEVEIHKLAYKGKKISEEDYKKMSNEEKDKADEEEVLDEEDADD